MALRRVLVGLSALATVMAASLVGVVSAQAEPTPAQPDFGPNVKIFDPSMPTSEIQATVDAIAAQQVANQFGPQRYALLFKPGTYGTAADAAELPGGLLHRASPASACRPNDVVINGSVDVAQPVRRRGNCIALNNFWRSLSNLTINVTNPDFGC